MENNFIKENNLKEELLKKNKNLTEKNKNLTEKKKIYLNEIIILKKDLKKIELENLQLIEKIKILNNTNTYENSSTQTDFIEIINNDEKELCKMIGSKSVGSLSNLKKYDDSDESIEMIYSSTEFSTDSSDE